jgi:hypothetical protein
LLSIFANDSVCSECASRELVCPTIPSSKLLFFSVCQAQIRFSKLRSFRGGAYRRSGSMLPCKKTYPVKNVSHVLSTSKSTCNSHNRPITMRRPINIITPWWKRQTLFQPSRLWSEMFPTITIMASYYFWPVESICKWYADHMFSGVILLAKSPR